MLGAHDGFQWSSAAVTHQLAQPRLANVIESIHVR
jgi:hypothetical protein